MSNKVTQDYSQTKRARGGGLASQNMSYPFKYASCARAPSLAELPGVENVEVNLIEKDNRTESLEVILRGCDIKYDNLKEHIGEQGAVIHSVDKVLVETE